MYMYIYIYTYADTSSVLPYGRRPWTHLYIHRYTETTCMSMSGRDSSCDFPSAAGHGPLDHRHVATYLHE